MTTVLHPSFPRTSPFDRPPAHSSSYPDLSTIEASMQYEAEEDLKRSYPHTGYDSSYTSSAPSSAPSSPTYLPLSRRESSASTPASSLSLDVGDRMHVDEVEDGDIDVAFPTLDKAATVPYTSSSSPSRVQDHTEDDPQSRATQSPSQDEPPDLPERVHDDQAVEPEPTRHVDYLSHNWREEDIWSSWRYITRRRNKISNAVRLENAAWRTWLKAKYQLKTVSPETLNWLKDCDVTWLYGPLQVETRKSLAGCDSQPTSHLSTSSSFLCKKPILKKKSASAVILERSRSQHSLLQRASEIIQQQQASPAHGKSNLRRTGQDFRLPIYTGSSVANTPAEQTHSSLSSQRTSFTYPEAQTPADQKHVLFNEEVRQVQAIESDEDDKRFSYPTAACESDEDEERGMVMAPTRSRSSNRSTPRGSFSNGENITIIPLPSTTLKYRTDTPEPQSSKQGKFGPCYWPASGRQLSPSPSQETLRPSKPTHNFLIDDDPEVSDEPWHASNDNEYSPYEDENEAGPSMRRTPSGMFMPYDGHDEDVVTNKTLFGQAIYAVNTFKDIAHVVWNVGWHRQK